jgi:hypothetical protein
MRNSKHQASTSRETPSLKPQTGILPALEAGSWDFSGIWMLDVGAFFACATCFGQSDSDMAQGMNWGIFTLLGVIVTVLAAIASFFVYIIRKEAAAAEAAASKTPIEV